MQYIKQETLYVLGHLKKSDQLYPGVMTTVSREYQATYDELVALGLAEDLGPSGQKFYRITDQGKAFEPK